MNSKKIYQVASLLHKLAQENSRENTQEEEKNPSEITRLAVFDFDGTLFASPERPDWWKFEGFWGRPETLIPPHVPQKPDNSWWSPEVVSAAAEAISNPNTLAVLLTGRPPKLSARITELVKDKGLNFQGYYFAKGSTLEFKVATVQSLLDKYPSISFVEMWDDRSEHIPTFEAMLNERNMENQVHLVSRIANEFENPPTAT